MNPALSLDLFQFVGLVVTASCAGAAAVFLCIGCIAISTPPLDGQRVHMTNRLMGAYVRLKRVGFFLSVSTLSVVGAAFLTKTILSASLWAMGISALVSALVFAGVIVARRP